MPLYLMANKFQSQMGHSPRLLIVEEHGPTVQVLSTVLNETGRGRDIDTIPCGELLLVDIFRWFSSGISLS